MRGREEAKEKIAWVHQGHCSTPKRVLRRPTMRTANMKTTSAGKGLNALAGLRPLAHRCTRARRSATEATQTRHLVAGCSPRSRRVTRKRTTTVVPRASPLDGLFNDPAVENLPDAEGYIDGSRGDFTITKVSFGSIALYTGSALLAYGFGAYFNFLPGESFSAIMLIYGFPASLIGFALKYAQLDPVPCRTKPEAIPLRETKATDIQNQIREDVTRYRYGDEQHLDLALERVLMLGRYEGVNRRFVPKLVQIREENRDGEYALVLEFQHKPQFKNEEWAKRLDKVTTFFGPGIKAAELTETEIGGNIALISDGSGAGKSGVEKGDVLPPLMPGLAPREME